jgi:hypothetical protein
MSSRRQLPSMKRKTVRVGHNHVLLTLKFRPNQGDGLGGGTEQRFRTKCQYHLKRLNQPVEGIKAPGTLSLQPHIRLMRASIILFLEKAHCEPGSVWRPLPPPPTRCATHSRTTAFPILAVM